MEDSPDSALDFILFYCEKDEDDAQAFKKKIEEITKAKGLMYNDANSKNINIDSITNICNRAVQTWFYITDNFINNDWMLFLKDTFLVRSITDHKNQFVPIWNKPKEEFENMPFGLGTYTGLNIHDSKLIHKINQMFIHPKHIANKLQIEKNETKKTEY